jgi:23S rRNA (uracil747-C5)-methyltransferase
VRCDYYDAGTCRSCTNLEVPYPEQLAHKVAARADLLTSVPAGAWLPPVASEEAHFRNKAKMVAGGSTAHPTLGILGADQRGVDLRGCPLYPAPITDALPVLAEVITSAGLVPYSVPERRGELKHVLVTASPAGRLMVRFVLRSTDQLSRIRRALPGLLAALPNLGVVTVNILPTHVALLEGETEIVLTERDRLEMDLGTVRLELPPQSFFQTNSAIAAQMYGQARAWADEIGARTALDLYCGVGGFALALVSGAAVGSTDGLTADLTDGSADGGSASGRGERFSVGDHSEDGGLSGGGVVDDGHALAGVRSHSDDGPASVVGSPSLIDTPSDQDPGLPDRRVVGIETSAPAIEGASAAAEAAGVTDRAEFRSGDATAFANPPRRGLSPELAGWLENSAVRHVLYSSCNATTLARDLDLMPSLRPVAARLFDMFPHTAHDEVMVLLTRD